MSRNEVGPVTSLALDARTGHLFEAINDDSRHHSSLHPILAQRTSQLLEQAREHRAYHGPYRYSDRADDVGSYPHPSTPGTHAEVLTVDRALKAREAAAIPVSPDTLREIYVDNAVIQRAVRPVACCVNCANILPDVTVFAGKYDSFPPPPTPRYDH